jgi:hypothetical protein
MEHLTLYFRRGSSDKTDRARKRGSDFFAGATVDLWDDDSSDLHETVNSSPDRLCAAYRG